MQEKLIYESNKLLQEEKPTISASQSKENSTKIEASTSTPKKKFVKLDE